MRVVVGPHLRRVPAIAIVIAAAACTGEPARVTLVPQGACGRPAGANLVRVTAFTTRGERSQVVALDQTARIADFPADTEQIGVEVVVGGGETGAAGKSPPLVFDELPDGATIPVFVAPPDGFCEIGPMTEPRAQPLIARAGGGVLLVGGVGPDGPVSTAEYYDPASQRFVAVAVPQVLVDDVQGFAGAALATLADGRVALIGGPHDAFVVFDPDRRAFVTAPVLIDPRAFHAAIAVGADEVVVAGGCAAVADGRCSGPARRQMLRYRLDQLADPDPVTRLGDSANLRVGARLFDLGIQRTGERSYLLAGGHGDAGLSDRFAIVDDQVTTMPGGHVQAAALDGGAVLTAFGDDAAAPDGAASVYPAEAAAARPIAPAPASRFVRLIALEDGRVLGFGGDPAVDPDGRVLRYDPTRDTWRAAAAAAGGPGALIGPALARLDDGSVLVVGGSVSAQAWLYRPSLVGPASGAVTVVPSDDERGVLTAADPATVTVTASDQWQLTATAELPLARALVGGPRLATGSARAIVRVIAGGVALIAQQRGPGEAIVAELAPGQVARLVELAAGSERVLCTGAPVAAFEPVRPVVLRLAIGDRDTRLSIDGVDVLACGVSAAQRGAWGVAALGAGAQIVVASIAVAR